MKKLNIYMLALAAVAGFTFTACDDDDTTTVAKAVMASVPSVTFEGISAQPQTIQVVADADWYSETPDNITVSPTTGHAGTTDVTITITDNLRDGTLDNPHEYEIFFRGDIKKSIATVRVIQNGDKYRGAPEYEIWELATAPDETVLVLPSMNVLKAYNGTAVVSDGTDLLFVNGRPEGVADGVSGTVKGVKKSDSNGNAYVESDEFAAIGTSEQTPGEPVDITGSFGSFNASKITYVSLSGYVIDGVVMVDGQSGRMVVVDSVEGIDLDEANNHTVDLEGYYIGKEDGALRALVNKLTVTGNYQTVLWREDFEWMEPWTSVKKSGQTVETNDPGAKSDNLKAENNDGKKIIDEFYDRGYKFLAAHADNKSERAPEEQIYMNANYLKFGLTGYQSGIILPAMTTVPEGAKVILAFDWCSQRQGSGVWDATDLVVIVNNDGTETVFEVPVYHFPQDAKYEWKNARIDLSSVKVDKNTKISIRNSDEQWPSAKALRWFIDNIKIIEVE